MAGLKDDVIKHSSQLKFYIILDVSREAFPTRADGPSSECEVGDDSS